MDDQLTDELRQKVVASLGSGRRRYPTAPRWSSSRTPSQMRDAEYFAPTAAQLRSFGEKFGVMVSARPSFLGRACSRRLARSVGKSKVILCAPETGGWLRLEAKTMWGTPLDGYWSSSQVYGEIRGEYSSSLAPTESMVWPLAVGNTPRQEGGVDAAVEWFMGHIGEFVLQSVLPPAAGVPDGSPSDAKREGKLHEIFAASCMDPHMAKYRKEVAEDREIFGKVMNFLAEAGDAMGLRVDNPSDSLWKRTVTLGEQARGCDRSIRLEKGQPGKNYQVLFLELQRPGFEDASGLTRGPLLRGGVYGPGHRNGFSAKQWNIPDINSPDFRAVLQDVARWFFSEIGPFIANPKALKGAATEGLAL